jgi:preprotein translocase subunit SecB
MKNKFTKQSAQHVTTKEQPHDSGLSVKRENEQPASTQSQFVIERLYVKGLTLDIPSAPKVFQSDWKPEIDMQIQTLNSPLSTELHEVVLKVTLQGKSSGANTFSLEVQQAGIFSIKNFLEDQFNLIVNQACPNILFPYARQVITNLSVLGTFPPIYLAPINFDAIYEQMKREAEQKAAEIAQ